MKNMIQQKYKAIMPIMAVLMIMLTGIIIAKMSETPFADNTFEYANGKYITIYDSSMEVQFTGISDKSAASVSIPATIRINNHIYMVTSIKDDALKNNTNVKKIVIGESVKTIGKNAFYGCKNLKNITIEAKMLTNKNVKANAFKGLNSKAVVTVPKEKLNAYKKILKAKGLNGKKQKIKGKKMESKIAAQPEPTFDPDKEIPAPKVRFGIGKPAAWTDDSDENYKAGEYAAHDLIPIAAEFKMSDLMYGEWVTRIASGEGLWIACNHCNAMFDNENDYYLSETYRIDGCGGGSFNFGHDYSKPFPAWHWIPDDRPCSAQFHISLPEGISYKKGTLKMYRMTKKEIDSSAYHVDVNGQDITVTIDNIKDESIHVDGLAEKISITMYAVLSEDAAAANTISLTLSYDNGHEAKNVTPENITIYSAGKGYDLCFYLKDSKRNKIDNAEFILYPKNPSNEVSAEGKHAVSGTSTIKTPGYYKIHGVPAGEYALVMVGSPAGYKNMPALSLVITEDGKITSPSGDKLISQGGASWMKMPGRDGFQSTIILDEE